MGCDLVMQVGHRRPASITEVISGPLRFPTVRTVTAWFILGGVLRTGFLGGFLLHFYGPGTHTRFLSMDKRIGTQKSPLMAMGEGCICMNLCQLVMDRDTGHADTRGVFRG